MKKNHIYIILLLTAFLPACEDREFEPKDHPFVITLDAIVKNNSVILTADIIDTGPDSIIAYGFIWGTNYNSDITNSFSRLYEMPVKTGRYNTEIKTALINDREYFVSAYIRTTTQEIYGNQVRFKSKGSLPPEIRSFEPASGRSGTIVTINGRNFSDKIWANSVKFGEIAAEIISASDTIITVLAPQGPETESLFISVETGQMKVASTSRFELVSPWMMLGEYSVQLGAGDVSFSNGSSGYTISKSSLTMFRYDLVNNSWTSLLLPENSGEAPACIVSGEFVYVLLKQHFWRFDPIESSWVQLAAYSGPHYYRAMVESLGKIFVLSFHNTACKVWHYNTVTNLWIQLEDLIGVITPPSTNWNMFTFTIEHIPYLGVKNHSHSQLWMFLPHLGIWEQVNNVPIAEVFNWKATAIGGSGFLALGGRTIYPVYYANQVWEYDRSKNVWIRVNDCPVHLRAFSSFTLEGKIYYIGESKEGNLVKKQIWEFDPEKKLITN